MCTVSMIMDHYQEKWAPYIKPYVTPNPINPFGINPVPQITKEEIEEFRKLLERAREYDKRNNEPNCELAEKKAAIKKIADQLGVKIEFL